MATTKIKTIDITPTWRGVLPILLRAVRGDSKRNKESVLMAQQELYRMAEAADKYNESVPKLKTKGKAK